MDTAEIAGRLGTSPRDVRMFLRSSYSTFVPVGSGARYDFTEKEFHTIEKRFTEWHTSGKPKPTEPKKIKVPVRKSSSKTNPRQERDVAVWDEEGPVTLDDIRDPRVRARVRRDARAAEDRLMAMLIAAGIHVMQQGDQ